MMRSQVLKGVKVVLFFFTCGMHGIHERKFFKSSGNSTNAMAILKVQTVPIVSLVLIEGHLFSTMNAGEGLTQQGGYVELSAIGV